MINRLVNLIKIISLKKNNKEKRYNYNLLENKDFHLLFIGTCST